jgi:hypothetical protein
MAQQFADLIQSASLPEQICGQRVAKHMGTFVWRVDSCFFQSPHHYRGNRYRIGKSG